MTAAAYSNSRSKHRVKGEITVSSMGPLEQLRSLARRKDIRSADRAVIRNMVRKLDAGGQLSYQERHNMWAYLLRYTHT